MKMTNKSTKHCLKVIQALIFVQLFITVSANAFDASLSTSSNENKKMGRMPANFTPNDDVGYVPLFQATVTTRENILKDDRKKLLGRMRTQIDSWEAMDEYSENWDIKSTGLYNTATYDERRSYVQKYMLKYVDSRISGSLKEAKKGSGLAKVRRVEQALKPDTKVRVSKNVRVRFSAKVIEQYGRIMIQNPYVETKMFVHLNGELKLEFFKNIKPLGVNARLDYEVSQGRVIASVDKTIGYGWSARFSSDQYDKKLPFQENAKIQLFYGLRF